MMSKRRVALVLTQRRDSGNWDPAGYAAAREMTARYDFDLILREEIPFEHAERTFNELAADGVDLIIGHASDYADPLVSAAHDHANVRFAAFSYMTTTNGLLNLAGWSVSWNEVEFLTGVAAGLASKAECFGTVRGVELVPAEYALENLVKGARYVNSKIRIEIEHIANWYDLGGAREATTRLANLGVDVIYPAADTADAAVQEACQELGILTFGEYLDEGDKYPQAIITSFLVNERRAYDEMGAMLARGEWKPGIRQMNTATGDIRFTPFRNVPDDVSAQFLDVYEALGSGAIRVD